MIPYSPKATFSVLLFICLIIFGMFLMRDIFHIDSYREDHFVGEISHGSAHTDTKNASVEPQETTLSEVREQEVKKDTISSLESNNEKGDLEESQSSVNSEDYFNQLIADYQDDILNKIPETENRTDIVLRYYPHEADNGKVELLSKYKFYIHERPVIEAYKNLPSNSIYFGDQVRTEDIQLIAYILVKEGLPIKQIIPSKFHDGWKSNAIEIGTDLQVDDLPILSPEKIMAFDNPNFKP